MDDAAARRRTNASRCSHAELDEATDLDDGDSVELGQRIRNLRQRVPQINIPGGACGTDYRHIAHIYRSCGHTA